MSNLIQMNEIGEAMDELGDGLRWTGVTRIMDQSEPPHVGCYPFERYFSLSNFESSFGLQYQFALRVAAVEKLESAHRQSLAELDALFASVQHRVSRGDL